MTKDHHPLFSGFKGYLLNKPETLLDFPFGNDVFPFLRTFKATLRILRMPANCGIIAPMTVQAPQQKNEVPNLNCVLYTNELAFCHFKQNGCRFLKTRKTEAVGG